jgi:HTH-type transcriptional regulator/antitoxin HigA
MKFPVAELRQRGHLPQSRQREIVAEALFKFLGTTSPEAWENAYASTLTAFRRCETRTGKPGVTASWLRVAELEANKISCEPFSAPRFQKALDSIRPLTTKAAAKFSSQMRTECAASGVALVFVPEFKGGGINGAARWLSPEKAMIALNIRGRFADIFWFTFFHEAAHVLRHGKRQVFIDTGKEVSEQEEEANRFASEFLIPPQEVDKLSHLKSTSRIRDFAHRIGIHPGIVVGQLAHRRLIQHGWFNDIREQLQWTNG